MRAASRRSPSVLAIPAATALLAACSAATGEVVRDAPPAPGSPAAAVASDVAVPPLALDVEGAVREDGDLDLAVTVHVAARLVAPPVLRVVLPAGAELLRGFQEEVLSAPGRDVSYRRAFRVHPGTGAVRFVVQSIGVGYGTRADAIWPADGLLPPPIVTSP